MADDTGVKITTLNVIMNVNLQSMKITAGERNPMTQRWHTNEMLNSYSHPISSIGNDRASINRPCTDIILIMEILVFLNHKIIIKQARLGFRVWLRDDLFGCAQIGMESMA